MTIASLLGTAQVQWVAMWAATSWHSTKQEAINRNRHAQWAAEQGVDDIVEVYDSFSCRDILRHLASRANDLENVVWEWGHILDRFPDLRIFTLADLQGLGQEADAFSKAFLQHEGGTQTGVSWALDRLRRRGIEIGRKDRFHPSQVIVRSQGDGQAADKSAGRLGGVVGMDTGDVAKGRMEGQGKV